MTLVPVARVVRAHGVRGEIRLKLIDPTSEAVRAGAQVWLRGSACPEQPVRVLRARRVPGALLVELAEVEDRDRADALRGAEVLVEHDQLPALDPGQYYAYQLVGCAVVEAESGAARGHVAEVLDNPAHPLLRVEQGGRDWLLPFVDAYVREVDAGGRRVLVADVAALLDLANG